jgi:hypothetical protein
MSYPIPLLRRLAWRRRVAAARRWQEAERRDSAAHNAAVRRIVDQAPLVAEYVIVPDGDRR